MSILDALRIRLQPKQCELWELWDNSRITDIGYGGARMGAKSGGGRRGMLLRRLLYPGTTGIIIRRSLKELEQSHIIKIFEEYPQLRQYYRDQKKELRLPVEDRFSSLFFGSAQTEKDMADFYSAEYADILLEEAQEFTQGEMEKLAGSNRCTSHPGIIPKMIYTFMPTISESGMPPIGLTYLKRVFKDRDFKENELNRSWAFIQAFGWDNIESARAELWEDGLRCPEHQLVPPTRQCGECNLIQEETYYSWPEETRKDYFIRRSQYGRKMASLTNEAIRDGWLYGKWDVFQGQYFPNFTRAKHVLSAEEVAAAVKPWHRKWLSLDWGYDHPFSVYWHAQDEKGRVITYREFWGRELNERALGAEIGQRSIGEKLIAFPCSWDAGKLSPRALRDVPKSIIQLITDALPQKDFPRPFPADSSPGTRPSGARLLSQLLDADMWHISEECPKLIECLPSLVRDPKNTEDVLKVDYATNQIGDDPYDAARMGLAYMLGSSRKPASEIIAEQAQKIEDPTARALFVHKRTMEAQDKARGVKPPSIPSWMNRVR